ncbi:redox-regulated ATPase YchF [bacterium]|nr:MAG: redox-regulated ATPase YchF [bacterium]
MSGTERAHVKLAITGFSNSGKTTVFNALTGLDLEATLYPTSLSSGIEPHHGIVKVPDNRLDTLSSVYQRDKTTHATIDYIDYVGITPTASGGDASQNTRVFQLIKDSDAIVHVVREFEDESVIHPMGTIDPVRDVKSFETELIFGDLEFVEKRLDRIELSSKKGKKHEEAEKPLLLKCREALENEVSLRNVLFNDDEKKHMSAYQFLTTMPEIIVINTAEKDMDSERVKNIQQAMESYFKEHGDVPLVLPVCGKIEMEIVQLPDEDAKVFLDDMGIKESAMNRLCRVSYDALNLISFFTIGKDEVRAWTIKKGTEALHAAGKVHTDMERGFIRAETVHFKDFIESGRDMHKAKEAGHMRQEGKTYIVQDGDIIHFKFNV